jgi:hypothetical protein
MPMITITGTRITTTRVMTTMITTMIMTTTTTMGPIGYLPCR